MPAGEFVVRDSREGSFLWVDKKLMAYISRVMGNSPVVVYSWLCYYASAKKQNCYPSVTTLAGHANLSRRTIIRILKSLEKIKVIAIDREKGKPNIYRLLHVDVDCLPSLTGDMGVTSLDGGLVTQVSLPVVTPGTLEQDIREQDLNKQGFSLSRLWITSGLPYAKPSDKQIEELESLAFSLKDQINLYWLIRDYARDRGYPPHADVVIRLTYQFKKNKAKIKNVYGWFKKTVDVQMRIFISDMHIKEHEKLKREPARLSDILAGIVPPKA